MVSPEVIEEIVQVALADVSEQDLASGAES